MAKYNGSNEYINQEKYYSALQRVLYLKIPWF